MSMSRVIGITLLVLIVSVWVYSLVFEIDKGVAEYQYSIRAVNECLGKGGIPVVSEMYKNHPNSTWYICLDPKSVIDLDFGQ